jgi:DNA polymerase III alpha subunit
MIRLNNRTILDDGTVICDLSAAVDMLYNGGTLDNMVMVPSDEIVLFNRTNEMLDTQFPKLESSDHELYGEFDWYSTWLTPDPYDQIDVNDFCIKKCTTQDQIDRVKYEMQLFEERHMTPVLRHIIYMVDTLRDANVVWGVGRGSSVSSFVLHLIGINRINPMTYNLDIREFLK